MFVRAIVVGLLAVAVQAVPSFADQKLEYPRVYGPTGRLYGPTQAHYQYQKQYGQPWHGYRGLTTNVSDQPRQHHFTFHTGNIPPWVFATPHGYYPQYNIGGAYPGYGWGGYPLTYQWVPTQSPFPGGVDYKLVPVPGPYQPPYAYQPSYVSPTVPAWPSPNAAANPVLNDALRENDRRWNQPIAEQPIAPKTNKNLKPTTPERQVEAAKHQTRGDTLLRDQQYLQAYQQYREALKADPNRAEAEFRLGFALVGLSRFDDAATAFKRGVALDPDYPVRAVTLEDIYGDNKQVAISSFEHAVAAWVREDIRDPDRLFLMGVLLHFDQNQARDRSEPFFEAAYRLAGKGAHLQAFLVPGSAPQARPADESRTEPRAGSFTDSPPLADSPRGAPAQTENPAPLEPLDETEAVDENGPGFPPPPI